MSAAVLLLEGSPAAPMMSAAELGPQIVLWYLNATVVLPRPPSSSDVYQREDRAKRNFSWNKRRDLRSVWMKALKADEGPGGLIQTHAVWFLSAMTPQREEMCLMSQAKMDAGTCKKSTAKISMCDKYLICFSKLNTLKPFLRKKSLTLKREGLF